MSCSGRYSTKSGATWDSRSSGTASINIMTRCAALFQRRQRRDQSFTFACPFERTSDDRPVSDARSSHGSRWSAHTRGVSSTVVREGVPSRSVPLRQPPRHHLGLEMRVSLEHLQRLVTADHSVSVNAGHPPPPHYRPERLLRSRAGTKLAPRTRAAARGTSFHHGEACAGAIYTIARLWLRSGDSRLTASFAAIVAISRLCQQRAQAIKIGRLGKIRIKSRSEARPHVLRLPVF